MSIRAEVPVSVKFAGPYCTTVRSLPWKGVGLTQRDPEYSNIDYQHTVWCPAYHGQAHHLKGSSHWTREMYEMWLVTLAQDHKPLSLIPLALWCLSFLAIQKGQSSRESTACPIPSSSTAYRQQSNCATAQVHHAKPREHPAQVWTLCCSRKDTTKETEER